MRFRSFLLLMLLTCVPAGEAAMRDVPVQGKARTGPVRQIVIHATGGPDCNPSRSFRSGTLDGILGHFLRNRGTISVHYVIGRDGALVRMVPETRVAYHVRGHNADSIGIELINDGDGKDPFPDAQMSALADLLRGILERHGLVYADIKAHSQLDDSYLTCGGQRIKRKQDPGQAFPWSRLERLLDPAPAASQRRIERMAALKARILELEQREKMLKARLEILASDQADARAALQWSQPQSRSDPGAEAMALQMGKDRRGSIEEVIDQLGQRANGVRKTLETVEQELKTAKGALGRISR